MSKTLMGTILTRHKGDSRIKELHENLLHVLLVFHFVRGYVLDNLSLPVAIKHGKAGSRLTGKKVPNAQYCGGYFVFGVLGGI